MNEEKIVEVEEKKKPSIWMVLFAIALLVGVGFTAYFYFNHSHCVEEITGCRIVNITAPTNASYGCQNNSVNLTELFSEITINYDCQKTSCK